MQHSREGDFEMLTSTSGTRQDLIARWLQTTGSFLAVIQREIGASRYGVNIH